MACKMVTRLLNEGIPCAFVLANAVYGADFRFRHMLEERQKSYVLAVRSNQTLRLIEEWTLIQTDLSRHRSAGQCSTARRASAFANAMARVSSEASSGMASTSGSARVAIYRIGLRAGSAGSGKSSRLQ
jgi:SRSO17 transposase